MPSALDLASINSWTSTSFKVYNFVPLLQLLLRCTKRQEEKCIRLLADFTTCPFLSEKKGRKNRGKSAVEEEQKKEAHDDGQGSLWSCSVSGLRGHRNLQIQIRAAFASGGDKARQTSRNHGGGPIDFPLLQ